MLLVHAVKATTRVVVVHSVRHEKAREKKENGALGTGLLALQRRV